MKFKLLLLLLLSSLASQAQEIQWMSLAEAMEAQKNSPQKDLYGCLYRLVWAMQTIGPKDLCQ